jgi:hypothetical protein
MYIYNVTIKIDASIETEWLEWMRSEHLDEVVATGMFDKYALLQLLEPAEDDHRTYIAQYYTDDESRYGQYIEQFAPALRQKGIDRFGDQFIAFRSILKQLI